MLGFYWRDERFLIALPDKIEIFLHSIFIELITYTLRRVYMLGYELSLH